MKSTIGLRLKMRAAYCTKVPDLAAYAESFAICGAGGPLAAVLDDLDTLSAQLAWQKEMLERANVLVNDGYMPTAQYDDWLDDLARGMPAVGK